MKQGANVHLRSKLNMDKKMMTFEMCPLVSEYIITDLNDTRQDADDVIFVMK